MASVTVQPDSFSVFGGKKPETPRFYACELKAKHWECKQTQEKQWTPAADTLATQLVPVDSSFPKFFDTAIISYKLRKPVLVKNSE